MSMQWRHFRGMQLNFQFIYNFTDSRYRKVNIVYNFQEQGTVKDMLNCALGLVWFLKIQFVTSSGRNKFSIFSVEFNAFRGLFWAINKQNIYKFCSKYEKSWNELQIDVFVDYEINRYDVIVTSSISWCIEKIGFFAFLWTHLGY